MNTIAVITARGGSKRIPRKNIKEFCGKPIITYSIKAALSAGILTRSWFPRTMRRLRRLRKSRGKGPFFRSADTANDYANTTDVMSEVLNAYKEQGREFDVACCIYPTAPFVTADKLKKPMPPCRKTGGGTASRGEIQLPAPEKRGAER